MSSELTSALSAIVKRLAVAATHDPQLRLDLRRLAEAVLLVTAEPEGQSEARAAGGLSGGGMAGGLAGGVVAGEESAANSLLLADDAARNASREASEAPSTPLPELTLGRGVSAPAPATTAAASSRMWPSHAASLGSNDLGLIENRCRLKAEGAHWAANRQRRIAEGADFRTNVEPKDRDIIARAKALPDCFLWMNHPSAPSLENLAGYETVANCFTTAAEALAIVRQVVDEIDNHPEVFEQAIDLLAEAQSALRSAIGDVDGPNDPDQSQIYFWLRGVAAEHQIFIQRHMRADDPADPENWSELTSRIFALDERLQESRKRAKQRRKLMGKVRHKASLIAANANSEQPVDHADSWRILAESIDEMIADGLPASNVELREYLLPIVDEAPDLGDSHVGFQRVMREIDRYVAMTPAPEASVAREPSQSVLKAAGLLAGRSIVVIGGEARPGAVKALEQSLETTVIWLETREHQSTASFEYAIARPDVALVCLAIRWSSHSFGDAKEFCDRYGKPLVRLPAGYNPNQVARHILDQCSERLKAG